MIKGFKLESETEEVRYLACLVGFCTVNIQPEILVQRLFNKFSKGFLYSVKKVRSIVADDNHHSEKKRERTGPGHEAACLGWQEYNLPQPSSRLWLRVSLDTHAVDIQVQGIPQPMRLLLASRKKRNERKPTRMCHTFSLAPSNEQKRILAPRSPAPPQLSFGTMDTSGKHTAKQHDEENPPSAQISFLSFFLSKLKKIHLSSPGIYCCKP